MFIIVLYIKGFAKKYKDKFWDQLRLEGYTAVSTISSFDSDRLTKFFEMEKQWSMFVKEL